jgi:putative flippase GtrA
VNPKFHHHAKQILLYILSGGTGALVEIGSYLLLLQYGMWYIEASIIAFILSYITAFTLHKYLVFKKPDDFLKHLKRHFAVEMFNLVATSILLFTLVEYTPLGKEWSKFLTMGLGAAWNFLLFKFLVFV